MDALSAKQTEQFEEVIDDEEITSFRKLFKENWHATITYCLVFGAFGLCVSFLGPTVLDLGCQTKTGMDTMGWVFVSQTVCVLIGSVLAGYLERRCSANSMIALSSVVMPVCLFIIPFCQEIGVLIIVLAAMGMNMGVVDCIANLQMIKLYGVSVPPFLQTMHFFYGVGAFVAPLIAEPFILDIDCTPLIGDMPVNRSHGKEDYDPHTPTNLTLSQIQSMSNVHYAFWIFAAVQIPVPIIVSSLVYKESRESVDEYMTEMKLDKKKESSITSIHAHGAPRVDGRVNITTRTIVLVTVFATLIVFMYDGLQAEYADYIYSYAVDAHVKYDKSEGAYLNAIFWGMFAVGRLISIPISTRISPSLMLCCNIGGCLISLIIILATHSNKWTLALGTACVGTFISSVTPTTLSITEIFIDATNSITTIVVVGAALGEMVYPAIESGLFVVVGPISFLVFANISVVLSIFVLIALLYFGCRSPKYRATKQSFVYSRMYLIKRADGQEMSPIQRQVKLYTRMEDENDSSPELKRAIRTENGDVAVAP